MKFFISCLVVLASVFFAATYSFAIGLEVAVGGWNQSLEGQLAYQSALPVDSIDFENELSFGDESRPFIRINADLPILPNVYFMGTPMEFEGNGSKTLFSFGGTDLSGELYSKAKLDHYDLALYYGVPFTGLATLGTLGIDLGINVRQLNIDMVVKEKTFLLKEDSVNETIYIPMGFLAIQVEPTDSLAIEAELRGIAINNSHYYDLIARLKLRFAKLAFAAVGWRHEDLEIDEKDILATVKISGPFLEAGLQF